MIEIDVFKNEDLAGIFREIYETDVAKEIEAAQQFDSDFLLDVDAQVRGVGDAARGVGTKVKKWCNSVE